MSEELIRVAREYGTAGYSGAIVHLMADALEASEARVKELEAALKPFAHDDLCDRLSGNIQGESSPIYGRNAALLLLGDFRRARAALGKPGAEVEP